MIERIKKPVFGLRICVYIIIFLVAVSYAIVAWTRIENKTEVSYTCEELNYSLAEVYRDEIVVKLAVADDKICRIQVPIQGQELLNGTLYVQLRNEYGWKSEPILAQMADSAIWLNTEGMGLEKDLTYSIHFVPELVTPIFISVSDDGLLACTGYYEFTDGPVYKIVVILGVVCLVALLIWCEFSKLQTHALFACISLVLGTILTFATPPLSIPDEYRHFVRAYQISTGDVVADQYSDKDAYWIGSDPIAECEFPKELADIKLIDETSSKTYAGESVLRPFLEKWKDLFAASWSGETVKTMYIGTSTISPLAYIPQIIGILLARIISPPIMTFYFARFASLVCSTIIITIAIKRTPFFKQLLFAIALLPEVIVARSSCSTDGFLLALIILLISTILEIKGREDNYPTKCEWGLFIVIAILIANIKVPYLLYFVILFMVCGKKTDCNRVKCMAISFIKVLGVVAVGILVMVVIKKVINIHAPKGYPSENIPYLLRNPVSVLNLVAQTLIANHKSYILDAFGVFGVLYFAYCLIIVQIETCPVISVSDRMILLIIYVGFIVGLTFAGYFMNVPLITYIWGIQSRYFIPALPTLFMAGTGTDTKYSMDAKKDFEVLTHAIVAGCALVSIVTTAIGYYV